MKTQYFREWIRAGAMVGRVAAVVMPLSGAGCGSSADDTALTPPGAANPGLPDAAALQAALDVLTREDAAPGAVVDVRASSQSLTLVSGTAELGSELPMVGADGRYRVGSVTKAVTAVAVLALAERGLFELDDAI